MKASLRKHKKILLLKDPKKALKKFSHFSFLTAKQYGEDMLALEMRNVEVSLNKPRYIGTTKVRN